MKAFFAYPAANTEVCTTILDAKESLTRIHKEIRISLWTENDISGRPLTDPIFSGIAETDFLIADITELNFNVTFEIGYAIGLGKRVYLVRNSNFKRDASRSDRIGIYDTIGFESYSDSTGLVSILRTLKGDKPFAIRTIINTKSPVYFLQTPQSNAGMIAITSLIKKSRLVYRSYIPSDDARLSAAKAIDDVASCLGAIIPLLPTSFADSEIHNIRAAFVAGLAHAMNKVVLMLQPKDGPAPLDVRDLVKTYRDKDEIAELFNRFAPDVTERLQADEPLNLAKGNFLAELSIGDSVAENEFQTLSKYYIRTDQYKRASRGEVNLVVGRKGAGKTALFSQLRNEKRSNVNNIIVDLKPEGYQLIRLREDVLDFLAEGARTHLVTALFEYVLYLETCYKVLEKDRVKHTRDNRLFDAYRKLQMQYDASGAASEGDFSERLQTLSQTLVGSFQDQYGNRVGQRLTSAQVTELIHKQNIRDIRAALSSYLSFKNSTWVLFDNLDKGWSSHGLSDQDVMIVRCLIDAARKIQHQMQAEDHDFHCIVFVRNDVYQNLLSVSPDFGKESRAVLDWTDTDRLRELLRLRLIHDVLPPDVSFDRVWNQVCVSHYKGEETSQYLIDRCLMGPRNLIKVFAHCRGFAVGLGHTRINEEDIEKGLKAYSLDLIAEADQELTDILTFETDLLYHFIGEGEYFTADKIREIILGAGAPADKIDSVVSYMLYYGFIGVLNSDQSVTYIFSVNYDMKALEVITAKAAAIDNLTFVMNPAFLPGLNL